MSYIYGLDLSLSNSGIAIFSDDAQLIHVMSIDTKMVKEHQKKLEIIGKSMLRLKKIYPPEIVVFERGFSRFAQSTEAIFKVVGLAQYIFCKYEQIFYSPMTVKKEVGGAGNMKKGEIWDVVAKMFPKAEIANNDQSDAISVCVCYFKKKGVL